MRPPIIIFISLLAGLLSACAGPGYYVQAVGGQIGVMAHTRPIGDILRDPEADSTLKQRLSRAQEARTFASRELGLPDNHSYRRYADLRRPYVTWNVYATPALSLAPTEWCFPVAGCVAYRGYFSEPRAQRFARDLALRGYDVYVAGVDAYSTLGWFSDPLPSPVLRRSDTEVAGIIFHELAHQRLYLRGDSAFNESFAVTVEMEGVRRWLQSARDPPGCASPETSANFEDYLADKRRQKDFVDLLLTYRAKLETLYAGSATDGDKLACKARVFDELNQAYRELRNRWGGYGGYDRWFAQRLNNAHLASVGLYNRYVVAFQALLARQHGDLRKFYSKAEEISRLNDAERAAQLRVLAAETTAPAPNHDSRSCAAAIQETKGADEP